MRIAKLIGGIIITILLGAIGSGLWERILSPAIDTIYRGTVSFIASIYACYLDSIYKEASRDLPDIYQKKIAFLILTILACYLIFVSFKYGNWHSSFLNRLVTVTKRQLHFHGMLFGGLIFVLSYFAMAKADYAQEIKSYSFHSMEILRPYIGESEYFYLKSRYYQISSSSDFQKFNEILLEKREIHAIDLPEFTPIE